MMTLVAKTTVADRISQQHVFPVTQAGQFAALCRVLGDETRLRILFYLQREKEINVRTFCELVTQSQPAVSHHLALLRDAGLVDSRRDGKNNYYHFVPGRASAILEQMLGERSGNGASPTKDDVVVTFQPQELAACNAVAISAAPTQS